MRIYMSGDRSLSDRSESSEMSGSSTKICSSSSSESSSLTIPANCRKSSPSLVSPRRVNISMHKFINSKGLTAAKDNTYFSPFITSNGTPFVTTGPDQYYELRPPQFVKKDLTMVRRRVSAICKIQEELKEMKDREEELRWQRVRAVGLSQPNLNLIVDETDSNEKEDNSESSDGFSLRSNSNPNLIDSIDNSSESDSKSEFKVGGPRRKIPLIQVWEQKIQKEVQTKK